MRKRPLLQGHREDARLRYFSFLGDKNSHSAEFRTFSMPANRKDRKSCKELLVQTSVKLEVNAGNQLWNYIPKSRQTSVNINHTFISEIKLSHYVKLR